MRSLGTRTLAASWFTRRLSSSGLQGVWTVTGAIGVVGGERSAVWSVKATSGRASTAFWTTQVTVGLSRSAPWAVRRFVGGGLAGVWVLRSTSSSSNLASWSTRVLVNGSVSPVWTTRVTAGRELVASWTVSLTTSVLNSLSLSWRVGALANQSSTFVWAVRTRSGTNFFTPWGVRALSGGQLTGLWATLATQLVGQDLITLWRVMFQFGGQTQVRLLVRRGEPTIEVRVLYSEVRGPASVTVGESTSPMVRSEVR